MPLSEQEELELLRLKKRKALQSQVQEYAEPTLGEKAKAFGYGAVVGFGGGLGEIEKFSGTTIPEFVGLKDPELFIDKIKEYMKMNDNPNWNL